MKSITWNHHERDRENCFADQLLLLFLHVEFNRLIPGNFSLFLFYLDRYELFNSFFTRASRNPFNNFLYVKHSYLYKDLKIYATTPLRALASIGNITVFFNAWTIDMKFS